MSLTEGERERINALARGNVTLLDSEAREVFDELVDDAILGLAFEVHRSVKTGAYLLGEIDETDINSKTSTGTNTSIAQASQIGHNSYALDVFGQTVSNTSGVPPLKKQCECVCPNCQRNLAASRFAPHLEKCMGMGRNSSRIASRRLATSSKESGNYREDLDEGCDNAEDEDWIEPGSRSHHGSSSTSSRRKRDKNSPRRNRSRQTAGSLSSASKNNENYNHIGDLNRGGHMLTAPGPEDRDRVYTPPSGYDQLTLEERSNLLAKICGVVSASQHHKICTRSTKCPVHSDAQRREVRLRWLSTEEESHVDIDSFTEGDTATLRESLAQLSNASSPAESTISTSSNPSANSSIRGGGGGSGGRRSDKSRRGNKKGSNKGGSKSCSRGSTPPLSFE